MQSRLSYTAVQDLLIRKSSLTEQKVALFRKWIICLKQHGGGFWKRQRTRHHPVQMCRSERQIITTLNFLKVILRILSNFPQSLDPRNFQNTTPLKPKMPNTATYWQRVPSYIQSQPLTTNARQSHPITPKSANKTEPFDLVRCHKWSLDA